jgi:hypothetical protein
MGVALKRVHLSQTLFPLSYHYQFLHSHVLSSPPKKLDFFNFVQIDSLTSKPTLSQTRSSYPEGTHRIQRYPTSRLRVGPQRHSQLETLQDSQEQYLCWIPQD